MNNLDFEKFVAQCQVVNKDYSLEQLKRDLALGFKANSDDTIDDVKYSLWLDYIILQSAIFEKKFNAIMEQTKQGEPVEV